MKRITLALLIIMMVGATSINAQNDKTMNNSTTKIQDGKVSIESIPATLDEFKALQAELGTTPEGCIMLQLVAMEMYRPTSHR